jgi:PAT family beta-lactamase induction signal transducer AmpG
MTQAPPPAAAVKQTNHGLREVLAAVVQNPRVALMLTLGFSSGLPFMLTAATLGYWLRDEGTSLKAIGFISWVGLAYTVKVFWAPIVDRVDIPLLSKFGRRRGWMIFAQLMIAAGLVAMAVTGPSAGLTTIGVAALVVAVASATQDIAVDALRIESAQDSEELGLFTAAFQLGYRVAILVADAAILIMAQHFGWPLSYVVMALLMAVGVVSTILVGEPKQAERVLAAKRALWTPSGFFDAVIGPFISFFKVFGWAGLLMLVMISLYRVPDFVIGPMATPFYHDLGFSKDLVGSIRLSAGLAGTLTGIAIGGVVVASLGYLRGLIAAGVVQGLAVASFSLLAILGPSPLLFGAVMFTDNMGYALAGVALVTYMSSLTTLGYTATQYALLSSVYTIFGKILKGFSGAVVEGVQASGHTLMQAYAIFFIGAGAIGIPAILLCLWLAALRPRQAALTEEASSGRS